MLKKMLRAVVLAAICVGAASAAEAAYPDKPIKFIVPYAPGGASDIVARLMQKALENVLPQPVVIINKPGAGGALGAREAKDAAPDGYTVLSTHIAIHTNRLMGNADFGYEDFEPVAETGAIELILTVPGKSSYKTVESLITAAKAKPDTITHATNLTSVLHLAALQFMDVAGFKFRFVQAGGGGARKPQMVGGQFDTSFFAIGEVLQDIETGDLRALSLMSRQRSPLSPNVPTIAEAGYSFDPIGVAFWWMVPKGTPPNVVTALADALEKAFANPETQKALKDRAYKPTFLRGEAFARKVASEWESVKALTEKFGIGKKK